MRMNNSTSLQMFLILQMIALVAASNTTDKSFNWAGYKWFPYDARNRGPGPNNWSATNVWIDRQNRLHLKLSYTLASGWSCAGLYTEEKFGFGTYRWFVEGPIDKLDRNVVLGLFTYGGVDYINEIDIEIAKWGRVEPNVSNLFYTVYPRANTTKANSSGTRMTLQGTYTTHRFDWTEDNVSFQSQHGFKNLPNQNVFFTYRTPATFAQNVPILSAPLHMNLWMFKGKPPTDEEEVEIVIHGLQYASHDL